MISPRTIVRLLLPATLLGAGVLTACSSDASGPSNGSASNLSVAFATLTAAASGRAVGSTTSALSFDRQVKGTDSAHTLVITRIAITLSRLELATVDSAGCADEDNDDHPEHDQNDDRCRQLETGPLLVELPVDNSVVSAVTVNLPAGTYRALEAKIRPVRAQDSAGSAFLAAHPEFAKASVRVEGTFDGTAFVYTGATNASLESEFNPPLTVGSSATSLTVHVSIDRWFANQNGNLIDPATANGNGANASLVADNIKRSFHAFEDREHHGDDGHGDDGFDDNGGNGGHGGDDGGGDDHGGDG